MLTWPTPVAFHPQKFLDLNSLVQVHPQNFGDSGAEKEIVSAALGC